MELRRYPEKSAFMEMARRGNCIPVCLEVLADTQTPVTLLQKKLEPGKPLFLLESVEGGERWGRYSFLGAGAATQVRVSASDVRVSNGSASEQIPHHGDPLAVLRAIMERFKPVTVPELPRFWGGLVGYFAYEMVSFFEKIENKLPPDAALAHFMLTDELYIFDNVRHALILVAHVFLKHGDDPAKAYDKAVERLAKMEESIAGSSPMKEPRGPASGRLSPEREPGEYQSKVREVKDFIRAGDIIQAVISQRFEASPAPDPVNLYRAQRYVNPSPYMFFFQLDDTVLVGSSPETMVRLENRVATLRPIAGTRPRGKTEQEDRKLADELLADPKERAEHLMLVDLGRNDLGRVAEVGTVQVTDLMFVERYSHVMHLVSNITADLQQDSDGWDLIRSTFPAGTLSGAPKVRAMEIIAQMEDTPRGPYGGAAGYFSFTGNMDLAITIRTACISGGRLIVRAGAGIVADSDPEREHVETVNKAMAIQRAMELVEKGG